MYEFSLKDFRGFREVPLVEIRPLTILVGENSAGKSSFLAGLKYIIDFIGGNEEASFNKDPFQLGTFQQIAHHRGGRAGRAREFQLEMRMRINRRDKQPAESPVHFDVAFENTESQATVSSINISMNSEGLRARIEREQLRIFYVSKTQESFPIEDSATFPRVMRTEFARYWPFLLRDLRFRVRRGTDDEQEALFSPSVEARTALLAEYAESFSRMMTGHVEATSAIRTKPLRTYTPGTEVRDGEGSHVPFEIAKLYRSRTKDAWKKLKDSIEEYGNSSDMFRELNIKSFGQSASDPFQIQFSHDGPKTNIVDLGYGTSQVLPILYGISVAPKRSKILIQQPEVHLHPRAQAALGTYFVDSFLRDGKQFVLETHSDYIVDRIRQAISEKRISSADVSLLFFERKRLENSVTRIDLDDTGTPIDPPLAYRNFFIDEEMRALGIK